VPAAAPAGFPVARIAAGAASTSAGAASTSTGSAARPTADARRVDCRSGDAAATAAATAAAISSARKFGKFDLRYVWEGHLRFRKRSFRKLCRRGRCAH
jgi:hypothetical protein